MGNFLPTDQINKIIGWRNYATTQQPAAFFPNGNPWFPPGPAPTATPTADLYARYFLGQQPPFTVPYTMVSTTLQNGRTDQAMLTRQQLIRLQRTLCTDPVTGSYDDTKFPQSLLQYLGTFSREFNRPAAFWPQLGSSLASRRWDMNNLALVIPTSWWPGHHGQGHAYGMARKDEVAQLFGLTWVKGTFAAGTRETDPDYYGHWRYIGSLSNNNNPPLQGDAPDFFQIIDYAMNQAVGIPANAPNHMRNTFTVAAAIIDQYDTDDIFDDPGAAATGNTITIIDYDGNKFNYAYGIERMSYDDPLQNDDRPPFAPNPLTLGMPSPCPGPSPCTALLNRRFENVGEFGYAYSPLSTTLSRTLDFASSASKDRAMLDFFTYNVAGDRAGIVNLNTRNGPVLASIISGALLLDPGGETTPTSLVSQTDALSAAQAIVQETTNNTVGHGPVLNRGDVARLAQVAAAALPGVLGTSDETKQTIARALAEVGQARTWNLMIDVIAQTGNYAPNTPDLSDPSKFIVQGEKRYWLHIALDRDDGTVVGSQLEEVIE
jgi:hypothetical protein